jgi:hypothetical protein
MTYQILGLDLHDTADRAKQYFAKEYGAKGFVCEEAIESDVPLKPTWQAKLNAGYLLCVEVRETPFSSTLHQFVAVCATKGLPVRLWVAVPQWAESSSFASDLKQARDVGIGVIQIRDDDSHEFHRPVSLSLFALKKTDLKAVPSARREEIKSAESTFRDGSPDQGCQAICQALELITKNFAEYTYKQGWWKQPKQVKASGAKQPNFQGPWANVLECLEERIDAPKVFWLSISPTVGPSGAVAV